MNNPRRKAISDLIDKLEAIQAELWAELCELYDEEQDSVDNTPEQFQNTDRFQASVDAAEALNTAQILIGEAMERMLEAMQ